jgi:hypothetical protein
LHPEIESDEEAIERLLRVERLQQILTTLPADDTTPTGDQQ